MQVRCQSEGKLARDVIAQLVKEGVGIKLIQKLWAGFTAGLVCSAVVGAVHFAAYSCARKWLLPLTCPSCTPDPVSHAPAHHGVALAPCPAPDGGQAAGDKETAGGDKETAPGKMTATLPAAVFAAAMTALVESPVELFRCAARILMCCGRTPRAMRVALPFAAAICRCGTSFLAPRACPATIAYGLD